MPEPPHVVLRSLRPLLGLLQLLLGLAELGQVECRDLLGVLDLLLVPEIKFHWACFCSIVGREEAAGGATVEARAQRETRGEFRCHGQSESIALSQVIVEVLQADGTNYSAVQSGKKKIARGTSTKTFYQM